jgi:phage tail-like protein
MPSNVRVHGRDPLRAYNFVVWSIAPTGVETMLAGVQKVSGLTAAVGAYETWEGGNNLHRYANPDKVTWEPIVLEQGLALDDTLEAWAAAGFHWARTSRRPAVPVKRLLRIDLLEPEVRRRGVVTPGAPPEAIPKATRQYLVKNAWVSRFSALPRLDALSQEVALLSVELIHEGWSLIAPPNHSVRSSPSS